MDYELTLFDRLEVIKLVNKQHNLENNAYLSFSGGKDSTILHYLLDMALPNNKIPRVFINTGIEYNDIVDYVKTLAKDDKRFVILDSKVKIKPMLEKYGYPFKSKEHSLRVEQFNKGKNSNFIQKYMRNTSYTGKYTCPKMLMYQFEERGKYNYSNKCCQKLKKDPLHKWEKENHKSIAMTGMRSEEGGNRARLGCIITDTKTGKIKKFHPLIKVDDEWENEFIKNNSDVLCRRAAHHADFEYLLEQCLVQLVLIVVVLVRIDGPLNNCSIFKCSCGLVFSYFLNARIIVVETALEFIVPAPDVQDFALLAGVSGTAVAAAAACSKSECHCCDKSEAHDRFPCLLHKIPP